MKMRFSAPRWFTWLVGLVLLVLGILGHIGTISAFDSAAFWLVVAGLGLMLVSSLVRGL
jgi:VIT1/CCC1 family predicted Fe2+/Mn2+ transporter